MVKRILCLLTLATVVIAASSDTSEAGSKKRRCCQPNCGPQVSCQPACSSPRATCCCPQVTCCTTGSGAKPIDPDEESLPAPKAVDRVPGVPLMQP